MCITLAGNLRSLHGSGGVIHSVAKHQPDTHISLLTKHIKTARVIGKGQWTVEICAGTKVIWQDVMDSRGL